MNNRAQAIFGSFDGLTSALGLIIASAITAGQGAVLVAAIALAVGSGVGMGAGEWLSDESASLPKAFAMALATIIGVLLPALPWIFVHGDLAFVLCGLITIGMGAAIAELRPGSRLWSYEVTFGVLIIASGLAIGASLFAGGTA